VALHVEFGNLSAAAQYLELLAVLGWHGNFPRSRQAMP
jgi:hypothetical protein